MRWDGEAIWFSSGRRSRKAQNLAVKYGGITAEFLAAHATIRVRPSWAFGIAHDDFTGSPTRWTFG